MSRETRHQRSYSCPDCGKPLRRIEGRMGPFWGCTDFPRCRATLNDVDGRPSEQLDQGYRCPLCTRQMVRAEAGKGEYWFCSGYAKGCKVTLEDAHGRPATAYRCPACGQLLQRRDGKHGRFWGCSAYPDCKSSFKDIDDRPDLDLFPAQRS